MFDTLTKPDSRPLYMQVKDILVERIHTGQWAPGEVIPSEFKLAAELQVSQGTVRKAVNSLADTSLVERRQGKGTYVVEHTSNTMLFKFFRIYDDNGNAIKPTSYRANVKVKSATKHVTESLRLEGSDKILEINRIRAHQEKPIIIETILLPVKLFSGLENKDKIPNTLYDIFQKEFSIIVSHVEESLTLVKATKNQAKELSVDVGTALLLIDRMAYDIEKRPIEKRMSYCLMDGMKYVSELK